MLSVSRRHLLRGALASCILGGLPRARAEGSGKQKRKAPRYFVTVFLRGGVDAVYTMDPKVKADVESNVDVPYGANAIVDTGKMPFGPHFRSLARWAPEMAILRGIQVSTANHETGAYQVVRMRTNVEPNMPSLHDIIGQHREEQPLAAVTVGKLASFEHSPGAVIAPTGEPGDSLTSLDAVDELSDEEAALLASSFKKHLARMPTNVAGRDAVTRENLMQAQGFFDRLSHIPRFKPEKWDTGNGDARRAAEDMQRTLWFLEHDLAKSVLCKIQFDWDSHYRNADKQGGANGDFTNILNHFLAGLHEKKNEHGTLAEQTVVVVGSELGRFPVINGNLGKDHFPEATFMVFGPGINVGNAFVPTGTRMEGKKIDFKTGKADDAGSHLFLDDVGATLLGIAGVNPALYGYSGRNLDFLVRA